MRIMKKNNTKRSLIIRQSENNPFGSEIHSPNPREKVSRVYISALLVSMVRASP